MSSQPSFSLEQSFLLSLLLKLFPRDEFERFARKQFGSRFVGLFRKKASRAAIYEHFIIEASQEKIIDAHFFDLLQKLKPDEQDLIESVRQEFFPSENEGKIADKAPPKENKSTKPEEISQERAEWRAQLEESMEAALAAKTDELRTNEPWIEAAAVLPDFVATTLKPSVEGLTPQPNHLVLLAADCDTHHNGRWSLQDDLRRETLADLWHRETIGPALNANPHEQSLHTGLLKRLVKEGPFPVRELEDYDSLLAASDLNDWFRDSEITPFDPNLLAASLERQSFIEPLKKLTGIHFRGRKDELALLGNHLNATSGAPIFVLTGEGGMGKSTLLGKFLLDLEKRKQGLLPWAYLDFDDPKNNPLNPVSLLENITRQLSLLFADQSEISSSLVELESAVASDGQELDQLLHSFQTQVVNLNPEKGSLMLVLDTFEQVQRRGPTAVDSVRKFLDSISEALPAACFIISGRAEIPQWDQVPGERLKELDPESADAVLKSLGVKKAGHRQKLIRYLGFSPLSLKLAAEAIDSGCLKLTEIEELVRGSQIAKRQGILYTRILYHLDGEVQQLVHPGLTVRRITPGIIREVLAPACGLDPKNADTLFAELPLHASLFEPDEPGPDGDDSLRHRQDVRETMLELMIDDPGREKQIAEVHNGAIAFYSSYQHPIMRAEEIYHRLMRGDRLKLIDPLWPDDLKRDHEETLASSLSRCWDEPLPARSRAWLSPRIGIAHASSFDERTVDWEARVRREAEALLDAHNPKSALALIRERKERSPGSPLHRLEARALFMRGYFPTALKHIKKGLKSALGIQDLREVLRLRLMGAQIALEAQKWKEFNQHGERAVDLAKELYDEVSRLEALALMVKGKHLQQKDKKAPSPDSKDDEIELEIAFVQTDDHTLRKDFETSRRIIQTVGAGSRQVLKKAVRTFGNMTEQNVIQFDHDTLQDLFKITGNTKQGRKVLSKMASEVGLPATGFRNLDLASQTIRHGKMGDALANILDQAGDQKIVRNKTMSMFLK